MSRADYNILAKHITNQYIDRLCGNDIDSVIIGGDLSKRVMVGMLAENCIEEKLEGGYVENASTKFDSIPSITVSCMIKKNANAEVRVIPTGLLFYTVKPEFDSIKEYIIRYYTEKDKPETPYISVEEIADLHPGEKTPLPMTYKSVRIEDYMDDGILITASDMENTRFKLEGLITQKLKKLIEDVEKDICIVRNDHMLISDFLEKERFTQVLTVVDEPVTPRWTIDISCTAINSEDRYQLTLQMVNTTPVLDKKNVGYIPKIFNAGLRIRGNQAARFCEIDLECFVHTYKSRPAVYAISENVSTEFVREENEIITKNVPVYYQNRLVTKDQFKEYTSFENLISDPITNLKYIKSKMEEDFTRCETEFSSSSFEGQARRLFARDLDHYRQEIDRFAFGIDQIEYKDIVKKAFVCMNKTFGYALPNDAHGITGWRLFQIVFIVSMIPELIRCEYKNDVSLARTDQDVANLLYFPTGGGKTEAFLGVAVFSMFFDRYRNKNDGITTFLKYPLRLLAVQQLSRVLTIIIKANEVKKSIHDLIGKNDFSLGFFVGKENTPNKIEAGEKLSKRGSKEDNREMILESDESTLNEYYRFIDTCPLCGQKKISLRFNKDNWCLEHVCQNENCEMAVLPLYIVDQEIYRYLPTVVVSTIDKMSMVGTTNEFRSLLGQMRVRCRQHGFSPTSKCLVKGCTCSNTYPCGLLKDPVPTLFIQDEMHLVKESLGTFDSHYESFINYYAKELVPESQKKQIRYIGATATITRYEDHIRQLYNMEPRRFPCEYPSTKSGEDFYSYTNERDITRIILGYAPYGRSVTDSVWESAYILRVIIGEMMRDPEVQYALLCQQGMTCSLEEFRDMLYDYWIELVYNNRKQDATDLQNAFNNQGNNFLEEKGLPLFVSKQMTSDEDFQQVRRTLFDIQENRKKVDSTNLILATSTISHGVDEDSFNLMYFFGMPNNNAEYIQAYSRTGRKYTGIVIDIIRLLRLRDRSYLKNFVIFHQNKDDLVESVPLNRWAKNAIYNTLPGLLSGLIMQYYTVKNGLDDLYWAPAVKKLLSNGGIDEDEAAEILIEAYGCSSSNKMSLEYAEIIREETHNILDGIKNGIFASNEFLSDAIGKFSKGRRKPMSSLRDTEDTVEIEIIGG